MKCISPHEICTSLHLKHKHGINIKDIHKIWEEDICPITSQGKQITRKKMAKDLMDILCQYVDEMRDAKAQLSKEMSSSQITGEISKK